MKDFLTRPAWIEINLDNFENNIKEIAIFDNIIITYHFKK